MKNPFRYPFHPRKQLPCIKMDAAASKFRLLFLLSILVCCSSGSFLSSLKDLVQKELKRADEHTLHSYKRELVQTDFVQKELKRAAEHTLHSYQRELVQTIQDDFMNPPITTFPTTPVTNPVTTPPATVIAPPDTSTPPMVTVPSANPVTTTPTPVTIPPVTNPVNPPTPITNPVTTPSTTIPGGQPVSNPVTTPAVVPPVVTNAPAVPGQSWCMARGGLPETLLQTALDYACGIGGADCSAIQEGASCYNPNSLQNHASYAFNSYYQKNPMQTSCDFGGAAMITSVNPSSGSCIFTTWSSSSASPTTTSPMTTPTPTPTTGASSGATPAGSGTPPTVLNASNPALGGGITGYGDSPPTGSTSSASMSSSLQPFVGCIIMGISITIGRNV